jgi:hypothetical protein
MVKNKRKINMAAEDPLPSMKESWAGYLEIIDVIERKREILHEKTNSRQRPFGRTGS